MNVVVVVGCAIAMVASIVGGVILIRRVRSNAQRIAYLGARIQEVGEIEAIMARSQPREDGRRRGHLRLLGLAPLAWVGASVGRRTVATAAAAIVASTFAMGGPDHKPWQPGTTPADAGPVEPAIPVPLSVPDKDGWGSPPDSFGIPQPDSAATETPPTSVETTPPTQSPLPTTPRPTTTTTTLLDELPTETTPPVTVEPTVPDVACLGKVPLSAPVDLCPGRA
jgi:hypothetical protein